MAKRKPKRSGRISLYLTPELHEEIAELAEALGLDINGLCRLALLRTKPHWQLEARLLACEAVDDQEGLARWQANNPGRPVREFLDDYVRHQRGQWIKDQVQFWHDIRFTLEKAYSTTLVDDPSRIAPDAVPLHQRKEKS